MTCWCQESARRPLTPHRHLLPAASGRAESDTTLPIFTPACRPVGPVDIQVSSGSQRDERKDFDAKALVIDATVSHSQGSDSNSSSNYILENNLLLHEKNK